MTSPAGLKPWKRRWHTWSSPSTKGINNSPSGFRREAPEGCCWRLGAPSHHHTDRGVHVSSSGVMATHGKSGNSSSTHCSVAGSVEVGAPRHVEPPSRITGQRPPCPGWLWPWSCYQCKAFSNGALGAQPPSGRCKQRSWQATPNFYGDETGQRRRLIMRMILGCRGGCDGPGVPDFRPSGVRENNLGAPKAVSYTHLTLPTICSV